MADVRIFFHIIENLIRNNCTFLLFYKVYDCNKYIILKCDYFKRENDN